MATAINPQTGERVRFDEGSQQWIPLLAQGAQVMTDQQVADIDGETQRRIDVETEIKRKQELEQPQIQPAQEEPSLLQKIDKRILDLPGGAAIGEFAAAVNRGTLNLADFFTTDVLNNALAVAGREERVPTLTEAAAPAVTGQFMEPGLAREAVRTGGEFIAPTGAVGQTLRTIAAAPKALAAAPSVARRAVEAAAAPAVPELAAGALAGAGTELGAPVGGAIGEAVAGEEGRAVGEQVGRLAGGVLAPVSAVVVTNTAKSLVTTSAKKLLSEAAPTIDGLKQAARKVYNELDNAGVTVSPSAVGKLGNQLQTLVRKEGFSKRLHPKVSGVLKEFDDIAGKPQTLSEIDTLRKITRSASKSLEPEEARLGNIMVSRIDDFMDNLSKDQLSKGTAKGIGAKYRDARQLWRRAAKAEQLDEAVAIADLSPAGFEKGLRDQFRSILKNNKKRKGFTPDELKAIRGVVEGTTLRNMSEKLGILGIDEKKVSGALMPLMGAVGGSFAFSGPGAIAVPVIGTVSKKLGQRLAKNSQQGANLVIRAGKDGIAITKAYLKLTPPKQRDAKELTELLLRPDISIQQLTRAGGFSQKDKRIINDAVFLVNAIKASQQEQQ